MTTTRLPRRVRAGVAAVAVLAVLAVGGATAAVRIGAAALVVGGGFTVSSRWSPGDRWAGIELENRSGTPITLRSVDARAASNIVILETRVIGPARSGLLMSSAPLTPDIQAAVDASRPVEGFVLPPHSQEQYQIAIRFRAASPGRAVLSRTAVVFSVWGLDHGVVSDGVYCVRAPGRGSCAPFD